MGIIPYNKNRKGGSNMAPTVSQFYGISVIVALKQKEHNPPHIHAFYSGDEALFLISNGELYKGDFPSGGRRLVKQFILKYKKELMEMWETGKYKKLPPID